MLYLIKNARLFAPDDLGIKDIFISNGKFAAIEDHIDLKIRGLRIFDAQGKYVLPGLIDQHIHIAGAGGKDGFASMTPEIQIEDLIKCGTTTAVGLLGTDGTIRSIRALYGKVQALRQQGLSSYMYSGYYGSDSVTITDSIQGDMVFIEPVLGLKIAIADIRSSYPTAHELVRKLREVRTGGLLSGKKGILHVHLGNLPEKMDVLFQLVNEFRFPIQHISPTHVGRTRDLFEQAIEFARLGGKIDITTGASKYTDPHKSVLLALEKGIKIDHLTFSSDGHAGLSKLNEQGVQIGYRSAPFDQNLYETIQLIKEANLSPAEAFKLLTVNPAANLGLKNKGFVAPGYDADLCFFDDNWKLTDVFANGKPVLEDGKITFNPDECL